MLLLDLSEVFDSVDHKILLERFANNIGILGTSLKCLESHMSCPSQSIWMGSEVQVGSAVNRPSQIDDNLCAIFDAREIK